MLLLKILLLSLHLSVVQTRQGTIHGSVLTADGRPLRDVRVVVVSTQIDDNFQLHFAVTDSGGKFFIESVQPGSYRSAAIVNGFTPEAHGRSNNSPWPATLTVAEGQAASLVIRLNPTATIQGRVTNSYGDPLACFQVELLKGFYSRTGRLELKKVASVETNDQGEYRLFWIPPGKYFVRAESSSDIKPSFTVEQAVASLFESEKTILAAEKAGLLPDVHDRFTYVRTYYPSVPTWRDAIPVEVKSGEQVHGIKKLNMGRMRAKKFRVLTPEQRRNTMRKATHLTALITSSLTFLALLFPAAAVSAHHNMSAVFDFNDRVTLTGTLTAIDWRNPHVELMVDAKRDSGAMEKWKGEGPNPGFFRNRDISKADFEKTIGAKIVIEVSRARDGSNWGLLRTVKMPDGKVIPLCPENC